MGGASKERRETFDATAGPRAAAEAAPSAWDRLRESYPEAIRDVVDDLVARHSGTSYADLIAVEYAEIQRAVLRRARHPVAWRECDARIERGVRRLESLIAKQGGGIDMNELPVLLPAVLARLTSGRPDHAFDLADQVDEG